MKSKKTLDGSPLGFNMYITKTTADTHGKSFEMEMEIFPHAGGTPVHIHPEAIETYEILEGQLEVYKGNQWFTINQGETVTIEKGEPHTFRNPTDQMVRVYNTHQPAMKFQEFFTGLSEFARSGLVKDRKMSFQALLGVSVLWTTYSREIKSVNPPHFIMKILGQIGRLRGMKY